MLDQEPGEHASEIKNRLKSQNDSTIVIEDSPLMDIINVMALTRKHRYQRCLVRAVPLKHMRYPGKAL